MGVMNAGQGHLLHNDAGTNDFVSNARATGSMPLLSMAALKWDPVQRGPYGRAREPAVRTGEDPIGQRARRPSQARAEAARRLPGQGLPRCWNESPAFAKG